MYNALEEIGYTTHFNPEPPEPYFPNNSNVKVLYDDGTSYAEGDLTNAGKTEMHNNWDGFCPNGSYMFNEVDGAADRPTILQTFAELANELTPEDQLFIYITGNGTTKDGEAAFECYTAPTSAPDYMKVSELGEAVKTINCAQMIFVLQPTNSGGFVNLTSPATLQNALCKNRLVFTATGFSTNPNDPAESYRECWMHNSNIDEFTNYFAAALRGHYQARWPWEWLCSTGELNFNDPSLGIDWHNDGCDLTNYPEPPNPPGTHPHPSDYNPDFGTPPSGVSAGNGDGYTQFIEAFYYARCMDTWCQDAYSNQNKHMWLFDPLNPTVPIDWQTNANCLTDFEDPQMAISHGFGDQNLYCLNGIAGTIYSNAGDQIITSDRGYLLGGSLNVQSNMTINSNVEITMGVGNAYFDIGPDKNLLIYEGFTLNGADKNSTSSTDFLQIQNNNNNLNLTDVQFNSVNLLNFGATLNITSTDHNNPSTTFTNCPMLSNERGVVNITYSNFNNSWLILSNRDQSSASATVENCVFRNPETPPALYNIEVTQYQNYYIRNNDIDGGVFGIGLFWSGSTAANSKVEYNNIYNCLEGGLRVYNSESSIYNNKIYNNKYGMLINDEKSNVRIYGDAAAHSEADKQIIRDCSNYEIYTTNNTFPYYMRYNSIFDEDRQPDDPLLYYDNQKEGVFNVANNCWGCCFQLNNDLKLNYGVFNPDPLWCLPRTPDLIPPDEAMYNMAVSDVDSGLYTEARNKFQLLVETYPKSVYAKAAMKGMFQIEPYAGNNFSSLQSFYLTNDSILADTSLTRLGDFLANECDVQMHNFPNAISWYEDRILNSADPNDSIFAIIDLGHLYMIMDTTGDRPTFIGSMPEYKPESRAKFVAYRDSLLSLIPFPKDHTKKIASNLKKGQLIKIVPNPSRSSTELYIILFDAVNANIGIYNSLGKLQQTLPITKLSDGQQSILFDTSNLSSGIYECMLNVNGKRADLKKLIVIK